MLIEIHMLQNHAPSNLNRDDTGSPKDCIFGGVPRARISSQCLKRTIRRSPIFASQLAEHLGVRTRRLPQLLAGALRQLGCSEEDCQVIVRKATEIGQTSERRRASETEEARQRRQVDEAMETRQLIFLDPAEVESLARNLKALLERKGRQEFSRMRIEDIEKEITGCLPRSVDIALFGRMTTSTLFEDVEASVQVAHAISTTRVEKQFDYFTAVDDLVGQAAGDEEQGAGLIGDVEFNSALYYKYFSLHWEQLVENLGGDEEMAQQTLAAFLKAAALTTPTGKQNAFAAHNPPDLILIEVKVDNIPISYANAFLAPVVPDRDQDVMEKSIEALSRYVGQIKAAYGSCLQTVASLCLSVRGPAVAGAEGVATLEELVQRTLTALSAGKAGEADHAS